MPAFRQYQQASQIEATDAFIIDRVGVGSLFVEANDAIPSFGGVLIEASGLALEAGVFYGAKTALGAFTVILPLLATVSPPAYVEIADMDYNLNVNNVTVEAAGADLIYDHAMSDAFAILNIANTITRFVANTNGWRVFTYSA